MRTSLLRGALAAVLACGPAVGGCAPSGPAHTAASGERSAATSAAASGTLPAACTLLSKAEAEGIVGEPVTDGKKGPEPPSSKDVSVSQCVYASADGLKSLGVLVRRSARGDNSPGYARQTMVDSGMKVQDVAGVGDGAFWAGVQLQAFKGAGDQVVVTVMGFDRPKGPRRGRRAEGPRQALIVTKALYSEDR